MSASFLLNHLWQSTLFAAALTVLILFFRKNNARVRFWIWLAASAKFLIPFSLFIVIGSSLDFGWKESGKVVQQNSFTYIETISQPFGVESPTETLEPPKPGRLDWIGMAVFAAWLTGFCAVTLLYVIRGRSLAKALGRAKPLTSGRAFEALQSLGRNSELENRIKLVCAESSIEPGVFGVFRPLLLLPEGMIERLSDSELEAVIAHEIAHVRRHDNLISVIHMFIEALFWFHPLIWWLGTKLVQEREQACDEEVLRLGKDPHAYAEGILKVCEFYLESPLACVAGITGADMKKRIHSITCGHIGNKLGVAKKLLLTGTAIVAIAIPITIGFLNAPSIKAKTQDLEGHPNAARAPDTAYVPTMTFDVASVRESKVDLQGGIFVGGNFSPPNSSHIRLTNLDLQNLVIMAYGVQPHQIEGVPREFGPWTMFNVEAKSDSASDERLVKLTKEQVRLEHKHMLQVLLAERFKLKVRWETRNDAAYDLVVVKAGRLKSTSAPPSAEELKGFGDRPIPPLYQRGDSRRGFEYIAHGATVVDIARILSLQFGRPVTDKTGLMGKYDFNLKTYQVRSSDRKDDETNPWPPLEVAIQDQLGLKLVQSTGSVQKLIIDHVEKPLEN
jgi:uncharacterized protein (TIGR03435 family)